MKDTTVFDSSLLLDHIMRPTSCEQLCTEAFPGAIGGLATESSRTTIALLEVEGGPNAFDVNGVLNTSFAGGDEDILHVDPIWGMKKFLLIALFVGGLTRFLTSATYRKFISEVLDPLSF